MLRASPGGETPGRTWTFPRRIACFAEEFSSPPRWPWPQARRPTLSNSCKEGELCTLQNEQFGCKDLSQLKRWIDINIEIDRAAGDKFLADQVEAGQCAQFKTGDRLRIVHYMGMRRLEVQRAGETERFIILLR